MYLKGPSLFNGYLTTSKSEIAFDNEGWFHTGDLATYDKDEDVTILGRAQNEIKYKHGRVRQNN